MTEMVMVQKVAEAPTLEAVTWGEMLALGVEARKAGDQSRWDLGDLGQIVARKWQQNSIKKFAKEIGMDNHKRMYEYVAVSSFWPKSSRADFPALSWSHYRETSRHGLPIEAARAWLEQANDKNWPVDALREAITGDPNEPITRRKSFDCTLRQADGQRVLLEMIQSDVMDLKDSLKSPEAELELRITWKEPR